MKITPIDRLRTLPVHRDNEAWEVGLIELTPPAAPPRSRFSAPAPADSAPTHPAPTDPDSARSADDPSPLPKLVTAVCISTTKEGAAILEPRPLSASGQSSIIDPPDDLPLRVIAACAIEPHAPGVRPWNYLPSRIHIGVLPAAMKQQLDDFFGPLGVIVEVKPRLERVETMREMIEDLTNEEAEHGAIPHVPAIMDAPGMTLERVRAFAQAARVFYDARPWRFAADTHDLWEIQPPPPWPELGYCTLMGEGGEVFGLAFYESPEQFMECVRVGETDSPQAVLSMPGAHWGITLDAADEAPPADLLLWKRESLPTAGKDRRIPAPLAFTGTDGSPEPTFLRPTPEQLTHMEAVLRAFAMATPRSTEEGIIEHTVQTFSGPRPIALAAIEFLQDDRSNGGPLASQVFDLGDPEGTLEKIIAKLGNSPDTDKLRGLLEESKAATRQASRSSKTSAGAGKKTRQGKTWVYVGPVKAVAVYQFRISLDDAAPPIWRRLLMRDDSTLEELHAAIQAAFGWADSHMHEFLLAPERTKIARAAKLSREQKRALRMAERAAERRFTGDPGGFAVDSMFGADGEPTHAVRLESLQLAPKSTMKYTYDFGDSWEHSVVLEKLLTTPQAEELIAASPLSGPVWKRFTKATRTPVAVCIGGERAGPLEDCGGIWGYMEVCQIMADPKHPEHAERKEWVEEYASNAVGKRGFDPARLDLLGVNKRLAKYLKRC